MLPSDESARWNRKAFNHMGVSVVLERTFFQDLVCRMGTGCYRCGFHMAMGDACEQRCRCARGFCGFNHVN